MAEPPEKDDTDKFLEFMPSWVNRNTATALIGDTKAKVSFYCNCRPDCCVTAICQICNCSTDIEIAQKLASAVQNAHGCHNDSHEAPGPECSENLPATHTQPVVQCATSRVSSLSKRKRRDELGGGNFMHAKAALDLTQKSQLPATAPPSTSPSPGAQSISQSPATPAMLQAPNPHSAARSTSSSKSGSVTHSSALEAHDVDMSQCNYKVLLQCPGCCETKQNDQPTCLQKAELCASEAGQRYKTQQGVDELWHKFNKPPVSSANRRNNTAEPAFKKGDALLQHMVVHDSKSTGSKRKVRWFLPSAPTVSICKVCWARCAGFYDHKTNSVNQTFKKVASLFNKDITSAQEESTAGDNSSSQGIQAPKATAVLSFLQRYLQEATDLLPESEETEENIPYDVNCADTYTNIAGSRRRVHLDVTSKMDLWDECVADMVDDMKASGQQFTQQQLDAPVSYDYFLKVLGLHYKVIIHKHKNFSQCKECLHYKERLKTQLSVHDRARVKSERAKHYKVVYQERVTYHATRRRAQERPDKWMSIITDAVSKNRTELPRFTRKLTEMSKFQAFKNQLYTVLVHQHKQDSHNKGGAFNFMVPESVVCGGNITAEVIWRTLLKLQDLREVWAENLHVQLDNTIKDNKNHTVLGFLAWLVARGHFHSVTVCFLPVGHTHEDIDAIFGVIVRYLRRFAVTYTYEELMVQVNEALSQKETSWTPSAPCDFVAGTHDWNVFFNKAPTVAKEAPTVAKEAPAAPKVAAKAAKETPVVDDANPNCACLRRLKNFAMQLKPDNVRPHSMTFRKQVLSNGESVVVMDHKHWAHDTENWNEVSEPIFNYMPDLADIRPAKLRPETVKAAKRCKAKEWKCGVDGCPCCGIWPAFCKDGASNPAYFLGKEYIDDAVKGWKSLFESTTSLAAAQSLPSKFALNL